MDDESATCRTCGAILEGRDVYEGICKACREEAALGSAALPPQPKRACSPAPPPPSAPPRPVPPDAIAIEATVDLDADTREIPADHEPAEPPAGPPGPPPLADLALGEEPQAAPPPQEPMPTQQPEEAPAVDELPVLKLDDAAPASETAGRPPLAIETQPPPYRPAPTIKKLPPSRHHEEETHAQEPPAYRPALTIKKLPPSRHHEEETHAQEPPAPRLRIAPRAPQPTPAAPAPPPAGSHKPLTLATHDTHEEPPAPAEPTPDADLDLPALEPDSRDRQGPPRIAAPEPEAVEPAPVPSVARVNLQLEADTAAGTLRGLLDEMRGQVEQLSKVLSTAHRVAPSAFWSGFSAAFGFVLALAVLAAVALGLTALIGVLFYPPAFDFVRQLFRSIGF